MVKMAAGEVESLSNLLAGTKVEAENETGLSFAGRSIKMDTEEDASEIVAAIRSSTNLRWLRLNGNTLGIVAAKAIAKALEKHPEFQRAHWSDMFTGRLKSEIPAALRSLGCGVILAGAQLVELDLSDNAFGPNGMEGLVDFLSSSSCFTLEELRLNNNGLGRTGGRMLARSLLDCHEKSVKAGTPLKLKVFVSGRGRLENEGAIRLAEAFKQIGTLEEVSMKQNGIFHEGITALADAFAGNHRLRRLDLNDNIFSEIGAKSMAKSLPSLTNLEVLDFGDCLVKTEGAQALAAVIKTSCPKLQEVILSANEIEMCGASVICQALVNKPELTKLDLCDNELSRRQKEKIEALMESSGKQHVLIVRGEDSEDEEEEEDEEGDDDDTHSDEEFSTPPAPTKPLTVSVSEFLADPSSTALLHVGQHRARLFSDHVKEPVATEAVDLVMKICSVVTSPEGDVFSAACQCTDMLLQKALTDGGPNSISLTTNHVLTHLGLIKSEDKMKTVDNKRGVLLVLSHTVQQSYFPQIAKDVFIAFLTRSCVSLDAYTAQKQQILQALHS